MKVLLVLAVTAVAGVFGQFGLDFQNFNLPKVNVPDIKLPDAEFEIAGNKISLEKLFKEEWMGFKMLFNKTYQTLEEEKLRTEIFIENRHEIATFNQLYGLGKKTFVQQLNLFSDLLSHQFNQLFNGFNRDPSKKPPIPQATTFLPSANIALPENVDWRELGAVTPVKYQDSCASCYAFSAAGALEGQWFRKTGKLVDHSPQNIMDCSKTLGNEGCGGGYIDTSFQYVRENPGLNIEAGYPFEGKDGECRYNTEAREAQCTGYVEIPSGDEDALKYAVANVGPISAAIDAGKKTFQHYKDGIYYEPECGNTLDDLNHAILIVGYGVEASGEKYWLVKNSYGPAWGIGGYFKLARDANNHCGIATQAFYPLV